MGSYVHGSEEGYLQTSSGNPSVVTWTVTKGTVLGVRASISVPFDRAGAFFHIGARAFILSGANSVSGKGYILHASLQDTPPVVSVDTSLDCGIGFDPYDIVWRSDEQQLYVLDVRNESLKVAPYSGGTSLPGPSDFSTAVTATQAPTLHDDGYLLKLVKAPGSDPGVRLVSTDTNEHNYTHVKKVSGSWTASIGSLLTSANVSQWSVQDVARANVRLALQVGGVIGTAVLTEDSFSQSVVSSVAVSHASTFVPFTVSNLVPGLRYKVASSDPNIMPERFIGLLRYGAPQVTKELGMPIGYIDNSLCWIGNSNFAVLGTIGSGSNQVTPLQVDVYLWLSARHADGSDPVTTVNGAAVLSEVVAVLGPDTVTVDKSQHGALYSALPIPNDHDIVGGVLLWQWAAVTATGNVAVSDVFGSIILDCAPPSVDGGASMTAMKTSGSSVFASAKAAYARMPSSAAPAIRCWTSSNPKWLLDAGKREVWQAALQNRKVNR